MSTLSELLNDADFDLAASIIDIRREPDLVITTDDNKPYLHRWHVIPRNDQANIYLHVQTSSDPERPLHDHPWDNQSVILSGGYNEIMQPRAPYDFAFEMPRRKGDVVQRKATDAHRLVLPPEFPYTMTLFTTGPKLRKWGFWIGTRWFPYEQCSRFEGNRTIFVYPPGTQEG